MDDLSALIQDDPVKEEEVHQAADQEEAQANDAPKLKPDITPEENLGKYKAAIIEIIIKLKSDGLSPAETTKRFNDEQIKTLSGKPDWSEKAMSQIYKFIDTAK